MHRGRWYEDLLIIPRGETLGRGTLILWRSPGNCQMFTLGIRFSSRPVFLEISPYVTLSSHLQLSRWLLSCTKKVFTWFSAVSSFPRCERTASAELLDLDADICVSARRVVFTAQSGQTDLTLGGKWVHSKTRDKKVQRGRRWRRRKEASLQHRKQCIPWET